MQHPSAPVPTGLATASRRRAPARRIVVVMAAVAALLATTLPTAGAQTDPAGIEDAAAAWLTAAYDAGEIVGTGGLADLIFALAGTGLGADTLASAAEDLVATTAAYVEMGGSDAGQLSKALLGIRVAGGDGGDVDGLDLEGAVRDLVQTDGDVGRIGDATNFNQSLGVMALAATEDGAPSETVQWLAGQRCPDGGIAFAPGPVDETAGTSTGCTEEGAGHLDTTAVAIQALLDDEAAADVRDGSSTWLLAQQGADGGFDDNANSTGLAAQALRAVGEVAAADAAADFIAPLQIPDGEADAGAIRFRADDDGSLLLATTQGVLAFGAPAYSQMVPTADTPPDVTGDACVADEGVTVVVDLTFFDAGIIQGCAPGTPDSGLDALRDSGFDVTTQVADFGEFVCDIEGLPELGCEQPFEGQFWAYSFGEDDGSWSSYQTGADSSTPQPGDTEGWRYGEGDAPGIAAPVPSSVRRLADAGRTATAIAVSRDGFADGTATGVVLTRADDFADALAGTPLAAQVGGPLLITDNDRLLDEVATEIQRVLPAGGTVHLLGGVDAVDASVEAQLDELGYAVVRVAGEDRITTAIEVADMLGDPTTLLITTGYAFADALSAGTAAAAIGDSAVLLTGAGSPHPAVDAYLAERGDATVFAIGGPAAAAYPAAEAIAGPTREGTAVAVAEAFFDDPAVVGIARRDTFADALAGGVHITGLGGPLLITPSDALAAEVAAYLCATDSLRAGVVYGGEIAITDEVATAVAAAIDGGGCG